jgi:hypothetical protein
VENILLSSFGLSFALFVWFHTDGFAEWCYFLGIRSEFAIEKFYKHNQVLKEYNKKDYQEISYIDFLRLAYKDNFFIKLITCPVCITCWLSSFVSFYFKSFWLSFPIGFFALLGYFILVLVCKSIKW